MMAKSVQIQKMSARHEAILQFMIANPTMKMSKVAAHFGVTGAWLSTIIWSDAFQNQLARRHDELFDVAVGRGIADWWAEIAFGGRCDCNSMMQAFEVI